MLDFLPDGGEYEDWIRGLDIVFENSVIFVVLIFLCFVSHLVLIQESSGDREDHCTRGLLHWQSIFARYCPPQAETEG